MLEEVRSLMADSMIGKTGGAFRKWPGKNSMLRKGNDFGARASAQVVVELIIDRFADEVDARIDHDEMRASRMGALEAA
jgi:hypothetical protein